MYIILIQDSDALCNMSILAECNSDNPGKEDLQKLRYFVGEMKYHCDLKNKNKLKGKPPQESVVISRFVYEKVLLFLRITGQFESKFILK